ncbi:MAG: glucose-1-phosphate cytidylyltransferase [Beijerinckiaceae bacterium]
MKTVILAGGFGTRLSEETDLLPKPMVEIGGRPILWHVMKLYEAAGIREFIICAGYKAQYIKRYFVDYFLQENDVEIELGTGSIRYLKRCSSEQWKVTIIDTGVATMTGGRLKRIAPLVEDGPFCMTYGDGLSDLDIAETVAFHRHHDKLATVTAVPSPGRFGILDLAEDDGVRRFHEKPDAEMGWINGGFFVLDPGVIEYIDGDATTWEREPLERLAAARQLTAFRHTGFWKPMDTLRDKRELDGLWASGRAPWRKWKD